jgi:hypothetical protein
MEVTIMANVATAPHGAGTHGTTATKSPAHQAYQILHAGFTVAPVLAGADKFFHLLVDWDKYVPPIAHRVLGGGTHAFMLLVGVIEIAAGLLVALRPRIGAYVVAAWLGTIIVALLLCGQYFDVALRDFGLCLAALALGRLSSVYAKDA